MLRINFSEYWTTLSGCGQGHQFPSIQSSPGNGLGLRSYTLHPGLCTLQHNLYFRSSSACPWDQSQHCRLSYSFPDGTLPPASIPCQRSSRSHPSSSVQSLEEEAKHYLGMVLSSSTKKTYSSGCYILFTNERLSATPR